MIDFNDAPLQGDAGKSSIDVEDIRNRLHANVRGFVEYIYSGRAFFTKVDARIGGVEGEPGDSLSISLRTGQWFDFSTGEGGDLIDLYRLWAGYPPSRDVDFLLSMKEIARDFLGDHIEFEPRFWKPSTQDRIKQQKEKLGDKPKAEHPDLGLPVMVWNYVDKGGRLIAQVKRFEPDGTPESKTYRPYCHRKQDDGSLRWGMGSPEVRPLYNLPALLGATQVILVEGEKCAAALIGKGLVATTAMQGAKAPVEKTDWAPLEGKRVIIWPDNDKPGLEYGKAAAAVLRDLRCEVLGVEIPAGKKDGWDVADCIDEGTEIHPILAAARPLFAKEAKRRLYAYDLDELGDMPEPVFLVDKTIAVRNLSMVWAPSGALKSFVVLDLCLSVASGMDWHGRKTKQGPVLYVSAEGADGAAKRAYGWWMTRGKGLPKPKFRMLPVAVSMHSKTDVDALLAEIKTMEQEYGEGFALIAIDTVARTFEGNENTQEDMGAYIKALDRLRVVSGAHVMVVHHSGVIEGARERGSGSLRNAADSVFKIERDGERVDVVNMAPGGKQKDFEESETLMLRSVRVEFTKPNGTVSNTLVLNDVDDADTDTVAKTKKARRTGDSSDLAAGLQRDIYEWLKKNGRTASRDEIRAAVNGKINSMSGALNELVKKGKIVKDERNVPDGKIYYKVSE